VVAAHAQALAQDERVAAVAVGAHHIGQYQPDPYRRLAHASFPTVLSAVRTVPYTVLTSVLLVLTVLLLVRPALAAVRATLLPVFTALVFLPAATPDPGSGRGRRCSWPAPRPAPADRKRWRATDPP